MSDRQVLDTDQKALEINLNEPIYGTFAEIGAGQEVARIFFKVGAAAGTIAKTMSAYDKTFSDKIYGEEKSGRYVCEARLYKMLDHEYHLLHSRLKRERPSNLFFVFADTIAALNYQRTIQGHGWLGVRFQLHPDQPPNDFVVHVKMLDNDPQLQQSAIGVLGVNMVYACFNYHQNQKQLIESLHDGIKDRVTIDLIRLTGPDFTNLDNRLVCLDMVRLGLTDVAMFDQKGQCIHASEFLYKKSLMVVRGHFRPPTLVTDDVFDVAYTQFLSDAEVDSTGAELMAELTLDYLIDEMDEINERDFLARADMLCALGHKVIVSNCTNHISLIHYLTDFKIPHIGLVIGVRELSELITEKYESHKDGMLLSEFGQLFTKNLKVYAYPALSDDLNQLFTIDNLPIPPGIAFLVRFLVENRFIVPVKTYNKDLLSIIPKNVYNMIQAGKEGWEEFVPANLAIIIKQKNLFGCHIQ
ncbi:MAG: TonB-dependent receptor, partial [Saprospiraceae bacterium]|nr:TonB-dependent receptor [Saprospiraceae bacterium]